MPYAHPHRGLPAHAHVTAVEADNLWHADAVDWPVSGDAAQPHPLTVAAARNENIPTCGARVRDVYTGRTGVIDYWTAALDHRKSRPVITWDRNGTTIPWQWSLAALAIESTPAPTTQTSGSARIIALIGKIGPAFGDGRPSHVRIDTVAYGDGWTNIVANFAHDDRAHALDVAFGLAPYGDE